MENVKTVVKIPKQIKVGGHTYRIIYEPHLSKDTGNRGHINHRKQIIGIDPENPKSQQDATLLHEIIHLTETVFDLDLSDADTDRISEGLFQVLSDSFGIEFNWDNIDEKERGADPSALCLG
tara:strand:+ start:9354 stop:9719 length:366 start_codon:yes stop_codon:yes gene_type:complete